MRGFTVAWPAHDTVLCRAASRSVQAHQAGSKQWMMQGMGICGLSDAS